MNPNQHCNAISILIQVGSINDSGIFVKHHSSIFLQARNHVEWELFVSSVRKTWVNAHTFRHQRTQNGGNTFESKEYGKGFLSLQEKPCMYGDRLPGFKQHRKNHLTPNILDWKTNTQEKTFTCSDSGKAFRDQSYFKGQMTTHEGEEKTCESKEGETLLHECMKKLPLLTDLWMWGMWWKYSLLCKALHTHVNWQERNPINVREWEAFVTSPNFKRYTRSDTEESTFVCKNVERFPHVLITLE